jgi:Bacterial surface protein, Ig-like domain/HYR domain/Domain of unknown function DUF11
MRTQNVSAVSRLTARVRTSVDHVARNTLFSLRSSLSLPRTVALLVVFAVAAAAFYSTSFFASPNRSGRGDSPGSPSSSASGPLVKGRPDPINFRRPSANGVPSRVLSYMTGGVVVPMAGGPESIAVFAGDCVTPKTDFNLGETVCAKVTGAPLDFPLQRLVNWAGPFGLVLQSAAVPTDPYTNSFTIPVTATSTVNGETVDNRGTWQANDADASDASTRSSALFTVHDPSQSVADLVVYSTISTANSNLSTGGTLAASLSVGNRGPDTAASVTATEDVPTDTTFASITQVSGPPFTIAAPSAGGGGTITLTVGSLAAGEEAVFDIVYSITTGSSNILLAASAASATVERDNTDNATTPISPVEGGGGGGTCSTTINCPGNITQAGDMTNEQGTFGALVTFNTPASSCGTVNCDHAPGSFFPVGSATVTCSDPADNTCSFTVTITEARPIVITLNGDNPMTVECHSSFTDPGATAQDTDGNPVPVTASSNVDPNTPGSYTITYAATKNLDTATATRTVNVVDTTPPSIDCPTIPVVELLAPNSTDTTKIVNYTVVATDACSSASVVAVPPPGSVFPLGDTQVSITATDAAGNSSVCTFTVSVHYNYSGFFPPVANPPTVNVVKAGRAVPVKFSLSGDKGLDIFAAGFPQTVGTACDTSAPLSDVTETVTAGGSSLSYDPVADQYIYVWKTQTSWAGTCRQLIFTLNDGTQHIANFEFK